MRTIIRSIQTTLALLASAIIPLAGLAQENDPLKPSSRWTFAPHVSSVVHTRILSDLRHHNKFGDNRSIFEIVDDDQNKKKREAPQHHPQAQLPEVPVTCGTELSPLQAFQAAFGKPLTPVTAQPIPKQSGAQTEQKRDNCFPSPTPALAEDQHHAKKTSADSRAIAFVPEKLAGIGDSWQTRRLTSWFAKCERRIRAAGFEEKIFAHQSLSCVIHFTDTDKAAVSILKSSGQPKIDRAALDAIGNASPFPLFPLNSHLKVDFSYPVLEMTLLSGRLPSQQTNARLPVRLPTGNAYQHANATQHVPSYVPPDPSLKNYYQWSPAKPSLPKPPPKSHSVVWPERNHF